MHPVFAEAFTVSDEIAATLISKGFKAEGFKPSDMEGVPLVGLFVTDPHEPKALWEFHMNGSDRNVWTYQIGASVGDEYEGIVYEDLGVDMDIETPAPVVAEAILRVLEVGIEPNDLKQIVAAYDDMMEG